MYILISLNSLMFAKEFLLESTIEQIIISALSLYKIIPYDFYDCLFIKKGEGKNNDWKRVPIKIVENQKNRYIIIPEKNIDKNFLESFKKACPKTDINKALYVSMILMNQCFIADIGKHKMYICNKNGKESQTPIPITFEY